MVEPCVFWHPNGWFAEVMPRGEAGAFPVPDGWDMAGCRMTISKNAPPWQRQLFFTPSTPEIPCHTELDGMNESLAGLEPHKPPAN